MEFQGQIQEAASLFVTVLVGFLVKEIRSYVKKKIAAEKRKDCYEYISECVAAAVKEVEQFHRKNYPPKLEIDKIVEIRALCLKIVYQNMVSPNLSEALEILGTNTEALGKYIQGQIEAKVFDLNYEN